MSCDFEEAKRQNPMEQAEGREVSLYMLPRKGRKMHPNSPFSMKGAGWKMKSRGLEKGRSRLKKPWETDKSRTNR